MARDLRFWLILAGTAAVMLVGLGERDLWDPDEPRYAVVAREMMERGDWLVMHINGRLYPDKPPMFFWAVGLLSKLTGGADEFTSRLPAALSGVALVGISILLAGRMFGSRVGILTGLILATSYTIIGQSRYVHMDMPLAAIMMLMFLVMYRGFFEIRNPRLWLAFFALGALALLVKGPAGLLVPMFAGFVFLVFLKVPSLKRPGLWAAALGACAFLGTLRTGLTGALICLAPGVAILVIAKGVKPVASRWFLIGFGVFALIVLAWLVPMLIQAENAQPGFVKEILFNQNLGRFSDAFAHKAPFYYFYWNFPLLFLPWVVILPGACAPLFRRDALPPAEWRKRLFLFAWAAAVFVFFSLSSSKRELYLIPALPAAAILTARFFDDLLGREAKAAFFARPAKITLASFASVMILAAVAMPIGVFAWEWEGTAKDVVEQTRGYIVPLLLVCAALLFAGIVALRAALAEKWSRAFAATAALLLIVTCAGEFLIMPRIADRFKSNREFGQACLSKVGDAEVVWFGDVREGMLFYGYHLMTEMRDPGELAEFLKSNCERFFITTRRRLDSPDTRKRLNGVAMYERLSQRVGSKELCLMSNRPALKN